MSLDPAANAALYSTSVLRDGDSFVVVNGFGDIDGPRQGLFRQDTRLLSLYRLRLGGAPLQVLSSAVTRDNVTFLAHLTNYALPPIGDSEAPKGLVHVMRRSFLFEERLFERISCKNYGLEPIELPLTFELGADFRDMFEVRGTCREARGDALAPEPLERGLRFRYIGLDRMERTCEVTFSRAPARLGGATVEFTLVLPPDEHDELYIEIGTGPGPAPSRQRHRSAACRALRRMRERQRRGARIRTGTPLFDAWLQRSRSDLALLTAELPTGPYPYAGIPWFSTPFGRDAVITALQTLWIDPRLTRGVLAFLAAHQANEESAFLDSAPGKVMHEMRKGEMAQLREVPFGLYYGGVDTTPLFVVLAGAYARRTGDHAFVAGLWPALEAATGWIERTCDRNRHGLLDYARGEASGLANQGWKDSGDSVFHADGRFPDGPIALVEVQAYAFAALRTMASFAHARGELEKARGWDARAQRLRATVEERFWMEDARFYGIALDGDGALCRVRASNAGHLLYLGLPMPERAAAVARRLRSSLFYNGWGVRTLARGEARYNPMSYHNGSVWPHDTALCAAGMARYGDRDGAVQLLAAAFEAAVHLDMRLPELYCGFRRNAGVPPVAYPVACLPQAWAAGSPFMLLQACLGLDIDGAAGRIHVVAPRLPAGIDRARVHDLVVGDARLDLVFHRVGDRVVPFVDRQDGGEVVLHVHG